MYSRQFLNRLYPLELKQWKTLGAISLFIALFLFIFQPLGLQFVQIEHKSIVLLAYGLLTFLVLATNNIGMPKLLPTVFNEHNWTVKKQILWLTWLILCVAFANYWYSLYFNIVGWQGIKGFFIFITFTSAVAIIPITLLTFIRQNHILKTHLATAKNIQKQLEANKQANNKINQQQLLLDSKKERILIDQKDIIFIESAANYLNIHYLKNNQATQMRYRATLKSIVGELDEAFFFKCHRAFIINLQMIETTEGNAQGYKLKMQDCPSIIPVSRTYMGAFKERLGKGVM